MNKTGVKHFKTWVKHYKTGVKHFKIGVKHCRQCDMILKKILNFENLLWLLVNKKKFDWKYWSAGAPVGALVGAPEIFCNDVSF